MSRIKIPSVIQYCLALFNQMPLTTEYKYLNEIIEFYRESVQPYKGFPRGCQDSEIKDLEGHFGFDFPDAYKEYLRFMGKDYSGIFVGSECFIDDVIENTKYVPELLAENEVDFTLPDKYLAFFSHQGYMVAWFELPKQSENPLVWFYTESENNELPEIQGTFTEALLRDMQGMASTLK